MGIVSEVRALRVVGGRDDDVAVVDFDAEAIAARDRRILLAEAETLEYQRGRNAYSDYIRKNGRRPLPEEAATIGWLLGIQVKAADGTIQPRRSKAERAALRAARLRKKERNRRSVEISRIRTALASLSETDEEPERLIDEICYLCEGDVIQTLDKSIKWLSRFAEEWHRRDKGPRARGSESYPKNYR